MKQFMCLFFLFSLFHGYSQTEGYSSNFDGSKTFYKTFGKGESILIINGGPGMNSEGFASLAQKLAKEYQTIIYDQRGTGKSVLKELNSKTITMKAMANDIELLRKHLKIKKWIVLGHSFGGMLASYYASLYPNSISKIILSSSGGVNLDLLKGPNLINANLNKVELDSLSYWNDKIEKGDNSHTARLGRGRALAPAYVYDRKFIPIISERLTQGNATINELVWSNMRKTNFDCTKTLKSFKNPVLIIQGKQDVIGKEIAETAHQTFINSKVILLDKCKHYGWLDAEEEYFSEIESFLKS